MLAYLTLLFALVPNTPGVSRIKRSTITPVSACNAVTRSDIEMALGQRVGKGKEEALKSGSTCDYEGLNGQVTITLHRLAAPLNINAEIESLKAALPSARFRNVADLGSHAFFLDLAGAGTQLHIVRGDREYVLVSVLGFGEPAQVSGAVEQIARRALQRF